MDKLVAIRIKQNDGTYSNDIPLSVLAVNVDWDGTHTLSDVLGNVDLDRGALQTQIDSISDGEIQVDSTLTAVGMAADAKATGDAIYNLRGLVGTPLTAATAASMTNTDKIYVYTGSETGYMNGNWYYYDGAAWVSGGVYNSVAMNMDTVPTFGSSNPVTSAGIKSALDATDAEIGKLKENLRQKTGLSEDAKIALLDCFEHVAWIDKHSQTYYDSLYDALYPDTGLVRITALFEQGSLVVYPETPLNDLKPYLTVTGFYKDGTSGRVTDYALSGTLTVGISTVTVSKDGKTATFSVTVAQSPLIYKIDSGTDLTGQTFDTGVNAFGIEQDFTVLAKITLFADTSEPSSTTKMKMLVTNGSIGNKNVFRLAIDVKEGLNYYVTNYMYGDPYASISGQYANVQHELIWVCRNENAQFRKVLYVDGILALDKEEDMTLKTIGTVSGTYVIGSSPISAEVGVFNIYNVALDYSDINTILGIDLQG